MDVRFGLIASPEFARRDDRGVFEEVSSFGSWESFIVGTMKAGADMGHHHHNKTILLFYLLEGRARVRTKDVVSSARQDHILIAGQGFVFRPSECRVISYLENSRFIILKTPRFDPTNPDLIPSRID